MEKHRIDYLPLDAIEGRPSNPKDHDIGAIVLSVRRFGFQSPLLLNADGKLLAGHGRVKALEEMRRLGEPAPAGIQVDGTGQWLVPVVSGAELTPEEAEAYMLADNRLVEIGGWNEGALAELFARRQEAGLDSLGLGWEKEDIAQLFQDHLNPLAGKDEDFDLEAALEAEPRIKRGEVWQLGRHRLMCGDTRVSEEVKRLVETKLVDAIITSPPYPGVGLWDRIWPGMNLEECHEWLGEAYGVWKGFSASECNWILNTADNTNNQWNDWWTARTAEKRGVRLVQRCIWYRNGWVRAGVSRKRLLQVHEWVLWLTPTNEFNEPWEAVEGLVSTVFTQPWDRERLHETPFPVALVERWLKVWSKLGQTVWDPFLGSGTTIIAAEKLGRICYGMEIEPKYCEVAIQRWESFTGEKAVKSEDTAPS